MDSWILFQLCVDIALFAIVILYWSDITPLSTYINTFKPSITSTLTIDEKNILILDLEHVLADIYPETRIIYSEEDDPEHSSDLSVAHQQRHNHHTIMAEDSPIVRASIKKLQTK